MKGKKIVGLVNGNLSSSELDKEEEEESKYKN